MDSKTTKGESSSVIRTPDQRLRVFVSSTLKELAEERQAVRQAVEGLGMYPVLFEQGARPHPPRDLYRAYLAQSHIFIGIYWQSYGWVAPDMDVSGLEDEYQLAKDIPKLIYIKRPAPEVEQSLVEMLARIKRADDVSYKYFSGAEELKSLVKNDLALMLTESFQQARIPREMEGEAERQPPTRRRSLPILPTQLIGRKNEVKQVRSMLVQDDIQLVTLTGPGGVGKTSLAIEAASGLREDFPGGVHWVPLAGLQEPELVISAIAQVLDVRERDGYPLMESLKDYLHEQCPLLLMDNFEQVISAGSFIAELLAAAPSMKALATSRAPLRLRGEHEYPVSPLELPDPSRPASPEWLGEIGAIRLFVERARSANPSFRLSSENAPQVVEIVHRLDGLPLAIELAAARIKMLPVRGILQRLGSRLQLLTGGAQDLPPRQQTIRSAIDWSYSLLDQETQTLFSYMSVFVGGFTLQAAEEICSPAGELNVFEGIAALIDNSLLLQETDLAGQTRYRMLETIREYALDRLEKSGEGASLRQRHADFYSRLSREARMKLFSGESEVWLDLLEAEYNNYRTLLDWLQGKPETVERSWWVTIHLTWEWYRRGYLNEARQWFGKALEQSASQRETVLRGSLLGHAGMIAMWQSDLNTAAQWMDEGLEILHACDDEMELATILFARGVLAVNQGQTEKAIAILEEGLELFQELEQEWFQAMIHLHLGNAAFDQREVEAAQDRMQKTLNLGQRIGDDWIVASAINNFGEIARYLKDYEQAEEHYLESRSLFQKVGSHPDVARENNSLGFVALRHGDSEAAQSLFEESLALHQKLGVKRGVIESLVGLAALLKAGGQAETAVKLFAAAQARFEALGAGIWPADNAEIERAIEDARQELGETLFAEAYEAGTRMDTHTAIELAKRSLGKRGG